MQSVNAGAVIQSGLILGATLAWSEVIKTGAHQLYPANEQKLFVAQLLYAIVITILLIIGFYVLSNIQKIIPNDLLTRGTFGVNG